MMKHQNELNISNLFHETSENPEHTIPNMVAVICRNTYNGLLYLETCYDYDIEGQVAVLNLVDNYDESVEIPFGEIAGWFYEADLISLFQDSSRLPHKG